MEIDSATARFKKTERLLAAYRRAAAVLNYDGMTSAPEASSTGRANTLAVLSEAEYRLTSGGEYSDLLSELLSRADELDPVTICEAKEAAKKADALRHIPASVFARHTRITGEAFAVWREAKAKNDFALFAPHLEKVMESASLIAGFAAPEKDPYDYWLNENEEGASKEELDAFFDSLGSGLAPLIREVGKRPKPSDGFLHRRFPVHKQRAFSDELMELLGVDRSRCSLGEAEHPYTTFINRNDVRVTTHYFEEHLAANMFSVLHECGHALYELNVGKGIAYSRLGHGASAGMHESQSRFYENVIGRSYAFAELILPKLQRLFPDSLKGVTARDLHLAFNRVTPSLKRTEADELTYSMHVLIRYELEKRLMSGEIKVRDLPAEWNALYSKYLGIEVPSDREGVLQDMHWASGLIGYFPTYALGNAYSAQILAAMRKELDVDSLVRNGEIPVITEWLREHIHKYGMMKTPKELLLISCGEGPGPGYYIEYLTKKYSKLYGL